MGDATFPGWEPHPDVWLLIAGAALFIPAITALMIAFAVWEHRNPSRAFIGPTHIKCGQCGWVVPARFIVQHVQRHANERRDSG